VQLRLATEPVILNSLIEPKPAFARQWNFNLQANIKNMTLPAPTLIGVPVDESGYRALYLGYALRVARAALVDRVPAPPEWQPQGLYVALLDRYLIRLGLRRWPVTLADRGAGPAPILLPEQDIQVYCVEDSLRGGSLYQYDPRLDTWTQELSHRAFAFMMPLPDGSGVVLQEQASIVDETPTRIMLWQRGKERVLFENSPALSVRATGQFDPTGRYLVIYPYRDPNRDPPTRNDYGLLDLEECGASGCEVIDLAGWPTWSPDGSQTLVALFESAPDTLVRGDRLGQPIAELGEGQSPFWLGDETYGYVRHESTTLITRTSEVFIASSSDDVPRVLLDAASLAAVLPGDEQWYTDSYVTVDPADTDLLLITVYAIDQSSRASSGQPSGTVFNLLFDSRSKQIRRQWQSSFDRTLNAISFSPDGRWLSMDEFDYPRSIWSIHLYDVNGGDAKTFTFALPTNSLHAFPTYGWSEDGRWLAVLSDGILHLVAPDHDYQRSALPDSPGCIFATWVNRS
jgi:hypothetical protein